MKNLVERIKILAQKPAANYWLATLSFSEAVFFPIPPDVLLIPLVVLNKSKAYTLAFITTLFSILGGVAGYFIGKYAIHIVNLVTGYYDILINFSDVEIMFSEYGIWVIFIASFSPIPYKVFTIAAGFFSFSLPVFILASIIGRGARFYSEVTLILLFQSLPSEKIFKWINWFSLIVIIVVLIYFIK